jgi:flagellar hook-associated protein 2
LSQVTISGAVSGLDTSSIINQLVSVQANQQTLLKNQQTTQQNAADALGKLSTSLGAIGSLASSLAKTSTWAGTTVTSNSTSVTASATGTTTGSLAFDVTSLAAAHAVVSANTIASPSTVIASGPLTLTASDGSTTSINVGSGTLSQVISGINAAGKGLVASAVQTAPGQYRLQVAATATGASSEFHLTGLDDPAGMDILTEGSDASITVGTTTTYQVTSSTNTFSGILPGVSFTVGKLENDVTVNAAIDGSGVATQVGKLVDAVNGVLSQISTGTAWNATTKAGGALVGDSTARSLQQQLLNLVAGAGAPGVSVTRDGTVKFDQAAFTTAFKTDPSKVKTAFGATTTFAPAGGVAGNVSFASSMPQTQAGTYAVQVTQLGQREQWSLASASLISGKVATLTQGSRTAAYTIQFGDTAATIAAGLNAAAMTSLLGVTAADDGAGNLLLAALDAGSAHAFTADLSGVPGTQVHQGLDVQGTIDGDTATGLGNILSLPTSSGGASYLALDTSGLTQNDIDNTAGDVGGVTYVPGLAQQLASLADVETRSGTGLVTTARQGRLAQAKTLQGQIDAWDQRLTDYRAQLTQQFTAMETALASLKSQTSALSGLSTSMLSNSSSGSS